MGILHKLATFGVLIYSQCVPYLWNVLSGEEIKITYPSEISPDIWFSIVSFFLFQLSLYVILPGKVYQGPVTPCGNNPEYKENGFSSWIMTIICTCIIHKDLSKDLFIYIGELQKALNYLAIFIVMFFYLKAHLLSKNYLNEPRYNGSFILDFYKGIELHPVSAFFKVPQKLFINSRIGMMLWGVITLIAMLEKQSYNVLVSGFLQLIYITKFFYWEPGYTKTMDITHDRCGYYLLWGCICYVPVLYTSPTVFHYFSDNYGELSYGIFNTIIGILSIYINWDIDTQRTRLREEKNKGVKDPEVWGKKVFYIKAEYLTENGKIHSQWLVASGYMGLAFHFNYLFEILASLTWTLGASVPLNIFAYSYVLYLTVLLVHRTYRDEKRCSLKYGDSWNIYKDMVPWKIIPYIF